jgi:putative ABC transport system permease protein
MKFLPFVFKHLRATWVRTLSTVIAMALCVFLFCILQSVLAHFDGFVKSRSPRRLMTRNAVSLLSVLPLTHGSRIERVPGVKRAAATFGFGGVLPARKEGKADAGSGEETDWTAVFQNLAVDAEPYFAMSPELMIPPDQFRDFLQDLRGCVVGRQLAEKFGWKIGDRFHLQSFVTGLRKKDGPFEFVVRGLIDTDQQKYPGTDTNIMYFHYRYLSEGLGNNFRWTTFFTVEIEDPARAAEVAAAIDAEFENSSDETFTETESAFAANFISIVGDLGALANGIGLAVCFTILLVTANTMSMSVRERRTEIAVLKTLGFRGAQVLRLIVAESLLLGAAGAALGLGATRLALDALNGARGQTLLGLSHLDFLPRVAAAGVAVALLLGLAAGAMPAWGAYRAKVTDMLRST